MFSPTVRYRLLESLGGRWRHVHGFRVGALSVRKTGQNEFVQSIGGIGPLLPALAYDVDHIATGLIITETTTLQHALILADELSLHVPVGRVSVARLSKWFGPYRAWVKEMRDGRGEPVSYRAFCARRDGRQSEAA